MRRTLYKVDNATSPILVVATGENKGTHLARHQLKRRHRAQTMSLPLCRGSAGGKLRGMALPQSTQPESSGRSF